MRHALASLAALAALVIGLGFLFSPTLAQGQYAPPYPPPPSQQVEPQTGPAGQPGSPQVTGPEGQPPAAPPSPESQAAPSTKPVDPFAGSPLLQMFERQPEATEPVRELRFARIPEEPSPLAVRLFLSAEEEFTDNVNQTKDNRKSEFRTRLVPGIGIRADRPAMNLSLSYAPEVFIPRNSVGDTEVNQNLSGRLGLWPTGKFQFNVAEDFTDSRDFRDIRDPGSRRTGTGDFIRNVVTGEAAYVLPRLRTALAYTNIYNREDQNPTDTRIAHIVRPNAAYTDPRFSITGAYTLTRGNEDSSVETPYWSHRGDGRFLHVLTPTISAGVTGYYQFQEPDSGRHFTLGSGRAAGTLAVGPDGRLEVEAGADVFAFQGNSTKVKPGILAAYTHRFRAFAVTARYEQSYRARFDDVTDTGVTFTRSAGIFLTGSFLRNLTSTFGVRYEENKFETTSASAQAGTTDRTWSADVDLRYVLARWVFLSVGYSGTFRFSTQHSEEFNENRVRAGLTFQYDLL